MLNGDDNENGFKTNRSNQQKTNCTCRTLFLLIGQKTNLHVQHAFFCVSLAVVLHNYNAVLYNQNVKLPSYTLFLRRNCRMCLPNILFPVFVFAFIFHCCSFSPFLATSISYFLTTALNFHVFLPMKFVSFVFNNSLQLFLFLSTLV